MSEQKNSQGASDDNLSSDTETQNKVAPDTVVSFHYRMCIEDDEGNREAWMEESYDQDPVSYLHGHNNIIVGLEAALFDRSEGDEIQVTIKPDQAYGPRREDSIQRVPIKHVHRQPGQKKFVPGMVVAVQTHQGVRNMVVAKVGKFNLDVDVNHPLAGKNLYYEIKIVDIRPASAEELSHKHAHGPGGHQH